LARRPGLGGNWRRPGLGGDWHARRTSKWREEKKRAGAIGEKKIQRWDPQFGFAKSKCKVSWSWTIFRLCKQHQIQKSFAKSLGNALSTLNNMLVLSNRLSLGRCSSIFLAGVAQKDIRLPIHSASTMNTTLEQINLWGPDPVILGWILSNIRVKHGRLDLMLHNLYNSFKQNFE
jgi:hypothetical protein